MVEFFGQNVSCTHWGKVDVERALRELEHNQKNNRMRAL